MYPTPFSAVASAIVMLENEPGIATVVLSGISIVFAVLVLLYLLITLEGVIFKSIDEKKKGASAPAQPKQQPKAAAPVKAPAPQIQKGIPGEVIAAIVAAITASEGSGKFSIRSIKRAKTGRSAWGSAGVSSNTEPF